MRTINEAYIDGAFTPVNGHDIVESINPATEQVLARTTLGNREDARRAIAAAKRAQSVMRRTSKAERIEMLKRLEAAVLACSNDIRDTTMEEYGGALSRAQWVSQYASQSFAISARALESYAFERQVGSAAVTMEPVGVAALIIPWNSVAGTMCSKLASALAAGCASIIKPSELGPLQARVISEAIHAADLPHGAVNVLLGRGEDVGDELATNPDVAKISFTGSTATGKVIAHSALATMKRVSLALTGKSASILLDDADLAAAIPLALNVAFMNNGQACVAGSRLLVPRSRLTEALDIIRAAAADMAVGYPQDMTTVIGPLATRAQYDRVQTYIRRGLQDGARIVVGGEGRPAGLDRGFFVRPTVFSDVHNDMVIAREEIFGPVLSVIAYDGQDDAIRISNGSDYGLQAYVFSSDPARARAISNELEAGTVLINRISPDVEAPFGGVKQSGIGREFGVFGLEAFLEPRTIITA